MNLQIQMATSYSGDTGVEQLTRLFERMLLVKIGCHSNITCDSCHVKNFFGYRYKCSVCDDYDLCSNCFEDRKESGLHKSNHPLKVIRSPDVSSKYGKIFSLGLPKLQVFLSQHSVIHDASCKSCNNGEKIKGLLFICDDCRGYRLCYNCFKIGKATENHEKSHCLLIRIAPRDYQIRGANISLEKRLGSGSFGDVYKCKVNGTTAAIKLCKTTDLSTLTGKEKASLENEIQIYQEFFCDYIVEIAGFGVGRGNRLFLLLEYLSSGNLDNELRSSSYSTVSLRRRFFYCENIIRGLFRMHKKGIIHKDLKPDNIFMTDHKTVKLGDLGIAFHPDSTSQAVRGIHQQLYYPTSDPNSCHPSYDIFAFGRLFNEIMTGNRSFSLTQAQCNDSNTVPYFGSMISACLSSKGRDRPTTQCVKQHLVKFREYLDRQVEQNESKYEAESLEKRNGIFIRAYRNFDAREAFTKETDENYQEQPSTEGKKLLINS